MKRRQFLMGSMAVGLVTDISKTLAATPRYQEKTIPLWPEIPPGGGGPKGNSVISTKGAVSNISIPTLTILTPEQPNGHAVLIAGGGGYKMIAIKSEARPAAEWLVTQGYTAYILTYRLPGEGWKDGNLVSLQDAQRALRIIRQYEKDVSVLGFSAGGHLMGMASLRPNFRSYTPQDSLDQTPIIVDKAALIYPIITLEKPYTHTLTHKILVGRNATDAENSAWSLQNYVIPHSPSFFLVQAENDPISNPNNTLIMASACEKEHVPVTMHRYPTGGHGFGLGKPNTPTATWPEYYKIWLQNS